MNLHRQNRHDEGCIDSMEIEEGVTDTGVTHRGNSTGNEMRSRMTLRSSTFDEAEARAQSSPSSPRSSNALNSSFDASLLNTGSAGNVALSRIAAAWDATGVYDELVQKDQQQTHFNIDMPDLDAGPSRMGRKALLANSPVRPRFRPSPGSNTKKLKVTPAKRLKAPHQRRSPHRVPPKTPRDASAYSAKSRSSGGAWSNSNGQHTALFAFAQDDDNNLAFAPPARKLKTSLGTHTTAASTTLLLETTSDSVDSTDLETNSSAPFRFTSFPASLPRIHNPRTIERQPPLQPLPLCLPSPRSSACPSTVRKRMSFGDCIANKSHDDGTNNTSLSSMLDFGGSDEDNDEGHTTNQRHNVAEDIDDDDEIESVDGEAHMGTPVARTRLNFNSVLSPEIGDNIVAFQAPLDDTKMDLSRPYEQKRINSFASSVSSLTTVKNLSGFADEFGNTSSAVAANMTPSRGAPFAAAANMTPSRGKLELPEYVHEHPRTPREVQCHFQLDAAQCSPIPGIPEEDGDLSSKSPYSAKISWTEKSRLCTSRDSSSNKSSQTSSRPMPDIAAFDPNASTSTKSESSAGRLQPPSLTLLCPPTPIRTPAWAHCGDSNAKSVFKPLSKYARSNSLIATKVLATCPSQVLVGRASLESSVLEEDHNSNTACDGPTAVPNILATSATETPALSTAFDNPHDEFDCEWLHDSRIKTVLMSPPTAAPAPAVLSMATHFEVLATLGRGTFADVYRVRSKVDGCLYAVKRTRRQFRGKRDRERALAEVKCMQNLQSVCADSDFRQSNFCLYLLFFFQAWQEDGHFFSQTELCCRDTCRDLMDSFRVYWTRSLAMYPSLRRLESQTSSSANGCLFPESTIWKICHDVSAGLLHIHSRGFVHYDIKPANIFFVPHERFGAICKIGDFGMAGEIGSSEDGQEGDQKYMAYELLSSDKKHPSADIFSLGLTLYELASSLSFVLPSEGARWHDIRSGCHNFELPSSCDPDLLGLLRATLHPERDRRVTAHSILAISKVASAGITSNDLLRDYLSDIEIHDRLEELRLVTKQNQTPRIQSKTGRACSPSLRKFLPDASLIYSPEAASS